MTDDRKSRTDTDDADRKESEDGAHTELRRVEKSKDRDEDKAGGDGVKPKPRSKVLPDEVSDDSRDDDLFNDMPV